MSSCLKLISVSLLRHRTRRSSLLRVGLRVVFILAWMSLSCGCCLAFPTLLVLLVHLCGAAVLDRLEVTAMA